MGANAYLAAVASYGMETNTAATVLTMFLDAKPGKRTAVLGYSYFTSEDIDELYFMQALGYTYASAAVASDATNVHLTAQPGHALETYGRPTNPLAASDWLAIEMTNGRYHFSPITTWTVASLVASLTTAFPQPAASGAPIYNFGVYTDQGHFRIHAVTSVTTYRDAADPFLFASAIKGAPMIAYVNSSASTTMTRIDYINVGYFTV